MRILLIEDDEQLSSMLVPALAKQYYIIDIAQDSQKALEFIETFPYDLLLLDIVLPGEDGITLCRQLRSRGFNLPIILLTARDLSTDKVKGLDAGADDYLVKPFDLEELLARIRALLRRANTPILSELRWGNLCLIPGTRKVTYGNQTLPLTRTEYHLLELFLRNRNRVFSCVDLIKHLWNFEEPPNESTIRSHIRGLRKKLKISGVNANLIENVYGLGYRLKSTGGSEQNLEEKRFPVAGTRKRERKTVDKNSLQENLSLFSNQASLFEREQQILEALRLNWEQFKESVFGDVGFLEDYLRNIDHNLDHLDHNFVLPNTIRVAHNLVGLLGSLGFTEAAQICRQLENVLQQFQQTGFWSADKILEFREGIETLKRMLEERSPRVVRPDAVSLELQTNPPLLLIIDDDTNLLHQLRQLGKSWGVEVEVANSLSGGRKKIQRNHPDAIILDLCFPQEVEDGLTLLAELKKQNQTIPVIVLTIRGELSDRLEAAKANAVAFLQKPFSLEQVLLMVKQMLQPSHPLSAKVLVVDDDPQFLSWLRTILESEELQIITLNHPQQFWQTLEAVSPDLLILDMEIPDIHGIDLCRVVRNDPHWHQLPILFLTAYTNESNLQKVVAVGGDDFISKSASGLEIQTRIVSHLQRIRRLQQIV